MYIPNNIVKEIQAIASMEIVLNHFGIVVKGHGTSKGVSKCPHCSKDFDDIKLNTAVELVNCFVCGFAGNVFNVIMEIEKCGFIEAVKFCAEIIGYQIPSKEVNEKYILDDAAKFYRNAYKGHLSGRHISDETAKTYFVGYATGGSSLVNHLKGLGYSDNELMYSGLVKIKENEYVDKYFKAAVFPDIRSGRVVDFYFRILDEKYKAKHQLMVGKNNMIGHHMLKGSESLAICESPIDAASFYQLYNIPAIAICGAWTKITVSLKTLIKTKGIKQVILAFDNDVSGQTATIEVTQLLLDLDVEILILKMAEGEEKVDVNKVLVNNLDSNFEDGRYMYLKHITSQFSTEMLKNIIAERSK